MAKSSYHFEFGSSFWTLMLVVVISVMAYMWREEIKTVVEHLRQETST